MNAHQMRQHQLYAAISESVLKAYGWVPPSVLEEVTTHVVHQITLEQAYHVERIREQAAKAGYKLEEVADLIAALHAPIGGA